MPFPNVKKYSSEDPKQPQQALPVPVYQWVPVETFQTSRWAFHRYPVPQLPIGQNQSWTINLFMKADVIPEGTTIIAGFGDSVDNTGTQRYVIMYQNGLGFWGSNADCLTNEPGDVGKWQMVTITYDAAIVSVYLNARQIKRGQVMLKDAEPVVNLATQGPWLQAGVLRGQIARFAVWSSCLGAQDIETLFLINTTGEDGLK